jgi:hypothetical protein
MFVQIGSFIFLVQVFFVAIIFRHTHYIFSICSVLDGFERLRLKYRILM